LKSVRGVNILVLKNAKVQGSSPCSVSRSFLARWGWFFAFVVVRVRVRG